MEFNVREVKYGYVIDFREYSKEKMKLEMPLVSELDNIYATKEECLEKAKEEISPLYDYNFVYGYIYIFQIQKWNININYDIINNIIEMIQDNNEKYVLNYGDIYSHTKEIKQMIENYFNDKNNWDYIEIMENNVEVYKASIKSKINVDIEQIN